MSWLLFMDESGHDHRNMPYEVRGGIALHAGRLWTFVQDFQRLERTSFGTPLSQFRKELKGCKLLDKDRFKWAGQGTLMQDESRIKHCRGFLTKGLEKKKPTRDEFTAYGQGCLEMARGIFELLREHGAVLFASIIPRNVVKPETYEATEFLRKDQVFLLERFFYFLNEKQEDGLLIMDEVDKTEDRRFVGRLEDYFRKTQHGRFRTQWIVPTPFFVSSDMTYPVQAADMCIYCINWGFRLTGMGMDSEVRNEIADEFGPWINQLQYAGEISINGHSHKTRGIVYVPDPYMRR